MHRLLLSLRFIAPIVASVVLAGCNADEPQVSNAPGPSAASDFAGATVEINPTIAFLSNGQLTYQNTASGSAFPAANTAVSGTYTYTPSTDYLTGNLTIVLPGSGQTLQLSLSSFTTQGGKVTNFSATYNGQTYTSTVTNGTLTASAAPTGSGGGTGGTGGNGGSTGGTGGTGGGTTIPTPVGANEALAPDIPATMQGTYNLTFTYVQTGSPIAEGTTKAFVIGAKSLTFDNKTLTGPVHRNQNAFEWIFKDGDLEYAVSIRNDNKLNEINVGKTGGTPWYGQYRDLGGTAGSGGTSGTGSTGSTGGSGTGGSGTGGSQTGGGLAAGTTFTRTVTSAIVAPVGSQIPASVPSYAVGTKVTFTVNAAGELTFSTLALPFSADGGSAYTYLGMSSVGNTDTVLVYKNNTTGGPGAVAMQFVRTVVSPIPSVQMIDYTLE